MRSGKFEIPDLSHIRPLAQQVAIEHFFLDCQPEGETDAALVRNLVRLMDLSIYFYGRARDHALEFEFAGTGASLTTYFLACGCMEASLDNLTRALKHLGALAKSMVGSHVAELCVVDPRSVVGNENRIREFRNRVQHTEEDLLEGKIQDDQEIALRLERHEFRIRNLAMRYDEYSAWLQQLHAAAAQFLRTPES